MRAIAPKLKKQIADDPFMARCCREDGHCSGRITWEHCWIYRGRQINEAWAIVPLCYIHHLGEAFDKNYGKWVSINRATKEDFAKYPRFDWEQEKRRLDFNYMSSIRHKETGNQTDSPLALLLDIKD